MKFTDFDFKAKLQQAISDAGFKEPSAIQKDAIPVVLNKKDMVGQAQTGTGKTAAFGLPVINMMECDGSVEALVIVPTRELAMQVSDELFKFGKHLNIKTATVYGGQSYSRQLKHIDNAGIIVATPGRLLDLLKDKKIQINPSYVVLDEADEMLDMGFLDDIKAIFKFLPKSRQTLLFSATMPEAIKKLANSILNEPEFVTVTKSVMTNDKITQSYYVVDEYERDDALLRLYDYKDPEKSIIFCRTKKEVDRLSTFLISQGFSAKGLHGDMEQKQREEAINAFKKGKIEVLIATDVAARGLDVNDVSHVFNYHLPFDSESYVHRIGRTGRAGKDGAAISIVTPHEFRMIQKIMKSTGGKMEAKVVPNIQSVKERKTDSLKNKIRDHKVYDSGIELVESLKDEYDLSSIAFKLLPFTDETYVKGSNFIGKSHKDIKRLLERANDPRNDKRRRDNSNRNKRSNNRRRNSGGNRRRRD